MSDIPAAHRARTAAQLGCRGGTRHEPPLVVHATGANDTPLLENQFYGCCVPQLYNEERPHSSLGYRTPKEFATLLRAAEAGSVLLAPPSSAANPEKEVV